MPLAPHAVVYGRDEEAHEHYSNQYTDYHGNDVHLFLGGARIRLIFDLRWVQLYPVREHVAFRIMVELIVRPQFRRVVDHFLDQTADILCVGAVPGELSAAAEERPISSEEDKRIRVACD